MEELIAQSPETIATTRYRYDLLDRLTSAQVPNTTGGARTVGYSYDKVGNRLSEAWDGGTPKSYAYATGNYLTSAGGTTYSYGKFGELRQKQASGTTTEYIYDGARRMVQVKVRGIEAASYVLFLHEETGVIVRIRR